MKTELFNLKHGGKVLFNKQKEVQGISVQLNFTAGAFNDKKGKLGVAHFCEHALFCFPNAKMTREERDSYRRKFEYMNAFTSQKDITFVIRMTEEDFEDAMDFVTESFASIKFTTEEFEKEKKIIEDEIKTKVQRNSSLYTKIVRTKIIKESHYNNITSALCGTVESLANISLEDVKEFKEKYLTLNNLCVSICGNISKKRVKNAVRKYVEQRIGVSTTQGFVSNEVNELFLPKFHFEKAVEKENALFACVYNLKFIPWTYEVPREYIISSVLSMILQELAFLYFRQNKNLCYSCSLYTCGIANHFSNEFYIQCQEENLDEVILSYSDFLKNLPQNIDKDMFEKHKRKKVLQYNFDFLGINSICDTMYELYIQENKLFNTAYRKNVNKEKRGITYEETNELYKTLFKTKPHVTIIANDDKYKDFDYKSFCKTAKLK